MKNKMRLVLTMVLAVALLLALGATAYAHDVPDLERLGSITITVRKGEIAIAGGKLALYRPGDIAEDDGNYSFVPGGDFVDCGLSFADLTSAGLAENLAKYAKDNNLEPVATQTVSNEGVASFADLPVGLYLVVQTEAAPRYGALAPFLVSLPYMEDGEYKYDLDAVSKAGLLQEPVPTEPDPDDPTKLPQLGLLWWPVPLLACGGLVVIVLGVLLLRRRRGHEE